MLKDELAKGYLDFATSKDGKYMIYVNRYTGFLYYCNQLTGEILTSNPVNPGYLNGDKMAITTATDRSDVMSQISVTLFESANSTVSYTYNSVDWSSMYGQLKVSPIANGLRVNYTLGDTETRFLLPGLITAERFEELILVPMIEILEEKFAAAFPDNAFTFFDNEAKYEAYSLGCINVAALQNYVADIRTHCRAYKSSAISPEALKSVTDYYSDLMSFVATYDLKNPAAYQDEWSQDILEAMNKDFPITQDGTPIYAIKNDITTANKRQRANILKKNVPTYTFNMMFEDEKECGYEHETENKPVIRCSLEYTFNDDGTLSVRLPANSISFDESIYTLESITPLQFFGAGDMSKEGFIFFPDGSGTIVEYDDFYNVAENKIIALALKTSVFGQDYCYSSITGAHREQVTMPVYGMVSTANVNASTATKLGTGISESKTGFFAIIEEGESLANLAFYSGGNKHKFAAVYASYNPYPSDTYDLSETLSVGALGTYTMVSESRYTGSYVTRYAMLSDDKIGTPIAGAGNYTNTSYVGMATYYRNYLKNNGTLEAIELVNSELPLYIETLGAMTIDAKFLTFPIEKTIPLTSFDNVADMFNSFNDTEKYINGIINEYKELLVDETDELIIADYNQKIERYTELLAEAKDINNINFRLTGFSNGGMEYTYPVKLKWERACGGRSDFKDLIDTAGDISASEETNFQIFPDFDFMYINNTATFDGIGQRKTVSRMIDNRYASKQVYNAVLQEYETFFTMVISSDVLDKLYSKFSKKYSKYDIDTISVSTLGSDLNSNFDDKNPINRDQSETNVIALLDRIANTDGYEVMIDTGNIYAVKYADHMLNVSIDSSHFRYSSYAIPFTGMVLHGYVSYAGSPLNYSGTVAYDVLRAIENGAAPYYILCYENTSHMKDDEFLNEYYGVDYVNWYDEIVLTYKELNAAIGDIQDYEIVDHQALIVERVINAKEAAQNLINIENELVEQLDAQTYEMLNKKFAELHAAADYTSRVKVVFDKTALISQFATIVGMSADELSKNESFIAKLDAVIAKYENEYKGHTDESLNVTVGINSIDYVSKYDYYTSSQATDEEYDFTDYTLDNGKVVVVTYKKGDSTVKFVLNYNIYSVNVRLGDTVYTLDKYGYVKIA